MKTISTRNTAGRKKGVVLLMTLKEARECVKMTYFELGVQIKIQLDKVVDVPHRKRVE